MRESKVVSIVESQLKSVGLYYANIHGSIYSQSGTPDILTMDNQGIFTGIEVKVPGKSPLINQARRCKEIVESGGRFIVAYDDFFAADFINCEMNELSFDSSEFDELEIFERMSVNNRKSYEVILNGR